MLFTLICSSQIIIVSDAEKLYRGKQVYQIVISLPDSIATRVVWTVASGTGEGEGNEKMAFCFGYPKLFNAGIPDTTGVLRVYNSEPIIARGIYKSWVLLVIAYNPENNHILYQNYEEIMFSKLPK